MECMLPHFSKASDGCIIYQGKVCLIELGPEYEVESIIAHRPRGRGYQFLTLLKGDPPHDTDWQPFRDFIDADGTMTEALQHCLREHNLDLPLTRTSMRGGGE
jgi:hypothetical protein